MEGIGIKVDNVGALADIALVRINGFVDTSTSSELQQTIYQLIRSGQSQFIIDLSAVQYVSSAGWGVFVGEIKNLRDKGGDLKIIHMTPEVFEVFEMLEFNRILTCYDSLEEAMDDFDFCRGIDLTSLHTISVSSQESSYPQEIQEEKKSPPVNKHKSPVRFKNVQDAELPLSEKVKKLVIENPMMGPWSIKKSLFSPRFGYTKIGYFKLRGLMRRLGLETKSKRYRYYRSR